MAAGFGVGVGVAEGVGVGVPPPPPTIRRGDITQPAMSKIQNTATQSRVGVSMRFNLNTWTIVSP